MRHYPHPPSPEPVLGPRSARTRGGSVPPLPRCGRGALCWMSQPLSRTAGEGGERSEAGEGLAAAPKLLPAWCARAQVVSPQRWRGSFQNRRDLAQILDETLGLAAEGLLVRRAQQ